MTHWRSNVRPDVARTDRGIGVAPGAHRLTLRIPASAACAAFDPNGRARTELRSQISGVSVAEPGNPRAEAVSESAESLSGIGGTVWGWEGRAKKRITFTPRDPVASISGLDIRTVVGRENFTQRSESGSGTQAPRRALNVRDDGRMDPSGIPPVGGPI